MIRHKIYKGYPNQPYISPSRNMHHWEQQIALFPGTIVQKEMMVKLKEGLLPGDILLLWRIGFDNFSNMTTIPSYLEFKYGIDGEKHVIELIRLGYVNLCSVFESLSSLTIKDLKIILEKHNLQAVGKKNDLIQIITSNISESLLEKEFTLRRYKLTQRGKDILEKYNRFILNHTK